MRYRGAGGCTLADEFPALLLDVLEVGDRLSS